MTLGTRRNLFRWLVGSLLGLAGHLTATPMASAQLSCIDWRFCGLCGCRCTCRGGSDASGSSGSSPGSAWWACCRDSSGRLWLVRYRDCCRPRQHNEPRCPDPPGPLPHGLCLPAKLPTATLVSDWPVCHVHPNADRGALLKARR